MSRPDAPLVVLAAGGTGGHLFPAEAAAGALLDRGLAVALVTDPRGQAFGDRLAAISVHRIRAGRLGRGLVAKLRALAEMGIGFLEARRLLRQLRPAVVVGFGGYPSIPTVLAAAGRGIPIVLHEQNAVLGRANRRLAGRARVVATAFDRVAGLGSGVRSVMTGNPVRPGFAAVRERAYEPPATAERFRILVLGGSQGARIFSDVVPAALGLLPPDQAARLAVVQQCRPEDLDRVRSAYDALGLAAELGSFFSDIPQRLAASHLVIARAGASTIAELTTAGRPAILVPYPFATDDHQTANAQAFAAAGGGWSIAQRDLTPAVLAERLAVLLRDSAPLAAAAAAAKATGRPDAGDRLGQLIQSEIAPAEIAPEVAMRPFDRTSGAARLAEEPA